MGLAIGAWALGEASRNRNLAIREEARRAVGEEQARIARELHDVIAHRVSVIVGWAGAADHVFEDNPVQARAALRSIEAASALPVDSDDGRNGRPHRRPPERAQERGEPALPRSGRRAHAAQPAPLPRRGVRVRLRREHVGAEPSARAVLRGRLHVLPAQPRAGPDPRDRGLQSNDLARARRRHEPGRDNSLYKLDTLSAALQVFREALVAEFEPYDRRTVELKE
jgi:Histidine kinase